MGLGAGRQWLSLAAFSLVLSLSSASWAQSDELDALNSHVAELYRAGRYSDAMLVAQHALAIAEKFYGPQHPGVATDLNNLALLLQDTNRLAEAEPLYRRALAIDEKSLGPEHPSVATNLNNLAGLLRATNRLAEAEPLFRRALAIDEKSLGPEHPDVATGLGNLAAVRAELGDWTEAAELSRRAIPILTIARSTMGTEMGTDRYDLANSVAMTNTWGLRAAARAIYRAENGAVAREEGFEVAQWALQTAAADALAQMSARQAKGAGPLAELVRQRQDLVSQRQALDKRLLAAVGAGNAKTTNAIRSAMTNLDAELDVIDKRLGREFPEYASFANPKPLSLAATQALLRQDEVLILFLDVPQFGNLPEEGLIWAVTKTDSCWARIDFGSEALAERVFALRCGLDSSNWTDASKWPDLTEDAKRRKSDQMAWREVCKRLTGADVTDASLPPFDIAKAQSMKLSSVRSRTSSKIPTARESNFSSCHQER
jgi:tetratricopeptide (TPR) repeat protein